SMPPMPTSHSCRAVGPTTSFTRNIWILQRARFRHWNSARQTRLFPGRSHPRHSRSSSSSSTRHGIPSWRSLCCLSSWRTSRKLRRTIRVPCD
ncbi:hypothetical protein DXG03_007429, partial [Asterophora parasitica]